MSSRKQPAQRFGAAQAWLSSALQTLENLVWPVQCAGCGNWDSELCKSCESVIEDGPLHLILDDTLGLPAWQLIALGEYDGILRDLILAAKHDARRDMSTFLFNAGQRLGEICAPAVQEFVRAQPTGPLGGYFRRVWVVPAPSSHKRRRSRAEVVPDIAAGIAAGLTAGLEDAAGQRIPVRVVNVVKLARRSGGMAGRTARSRGRSRVGSMRLERPVPTGTLVVLADDVSTSGATLREMTRLLGPSVVVCAVLAAAP